MVYPSFMKTCKWENKYKAWTGTAAELAEAAKEVIATVDMKDPEVQPSERLIRHYAQMGVLDRPEQKGREAHFGFRQLAQYLVARNLALDGWPLAKIAEFTIKSNLPGLLDLIPKPLIQSDSSAATENITRTRGKISEQITKPNLPDKSHSEPLDDLTRPQTKQVIEIALTPWCKVFLDPNSGKDLRPNEAVLIGRALTKVLLEIPKNHIKLGAHE